MKLETIIQSEVSQKEKEKEKYCMIWSARVYLQDNLKADVTINKALITDF